MSYHLLEYAKRHFYKGAQTSGCLNRISRIASEANQTVPLFNIDLSGLFSTGAVAAAEDMTRLLPT